MQPTPLQSIPMVEGSAFVVLVSAFSAMLYWMIRSLSVALLKLNSTMNANTLTLTTLMLIVIRHDAQIRGIHPSAGETADARNRDAIRVYTELCTEIENLRQQLMQMERSA